MVVLSKTEVAVIKPDLMPPTHALWPWPIVFFVARAQATCSVIGVTQVIYITSGQGLRHNKL
jgi:hypothetical protein